MSIYKHKNISLWRMLAKLLRGIVHSFNGWPLMLLVAFIVSPVTPHMRWEYTYRAAGTYRVYSHCTYLGKSGFVEYRRGETCPFITLINSNHN
jgi:hypothetical protein